MGSSRLHRPAAGVFRNEPDMSMTLMGPLPLSTGKESGMSEAACTPPDITFEKSDFRILLVDDEETMLNLMNDVLVDAGYPCENASNGEAAMTILNQQRIDLVVSDMRMPGMSGVELTSAISETKPEIRTILITGYTDYDSLTEAMKLRAFGFLRKPFSNHELLELVAEAYVSKVRSLEQEAHNEMLKHAMAESTKELEFRTERLAAEKGILHGIISCANFGLVAVDTAGLVHLMNPLAARLLQIEASGATCLPGQPFVGLLPDYLAPLFTQLYNTILAKHTVEELTSIGYSDGQRLNVIAYPLWHGQQVTAVVFVIHDVTEKELLQQSLLQNARLASIGELAAGVAHEINNPLGFVTSNCNSLVGYLDSLGTYLPYT